MADVYISRQDYRDAAQVAASAPAQYNGWEANTPSENIAASGVPTSISAGGSAEIPADFKDHKTVFVVTAAAAANVAFKAGDSDGGANDVIRQFPAGTSIIWLESAPFVKKATGKITITSDKAIDIIGYEMR